MKRQRKNPAKKVAKKLQDRAKQIPLAARLAAAEQKAARLEEENVKFAKELIRWQDTVKLRDEAIERKEQQIKEQMAINQQLTSQVTELTGMQEGLAPSGLQYGKVLEAEVEARKRAQEERDLANMRAVEDESTIAELANEVARLHAECDRLAPKGDDRGSAIYNLKVLNNNLSIDLKNSQAAKAMWESRADALAEELARLKKPAPAEPHHQAMPLVSCTVTVRLEHPGQVTFTFPREAIKVDESIVHWSQGG